MSQRTWTGGASSIAQTFVRSVPASPTTGNTYTIALADELGGTATFTYTVASGDTGTMVVSAIVGAISASSDPRALAVAATGATNTLTLTAMSQGVPFYATTSGAGTWAVLPSVSNRGPNDFNCPANYVENAVPIAGDNLSITGTNSIKYGQFNSYLALGAFSNVDAGAAIGGPGLYLRITCTSFLWGGTGKSFIDLGSSAISPRITNTASASSPSHGLLLLGSAMTTLNVEGGSVGVASGSGLTASATTVQVSNGRVRLAAGATVTNYYQASGKGNEINCAVTTAIVEGGTLTTEGTGTIGTLTVSGGTPTGAVVTSNSTGTISSLKVNSGTVDFTQSALPRTVSAVNPIGLGGVVSYDPAIVTFTAAPLPVTNAGPITISVAAAA